MHFPQISTGRKNFVKQDTEESYDNEMFEDTSFNASEIDLSEPSSELLLTQQDKSEKRSNILQRLVCNKVVITSNDLSEHN